MPRVIEDDDSDSDATPVMIENEQSEPEQNGYDSDTESLALPSPPRVRTRKECNLVVTPNSEQRLKMRKKIIKQFDSETETESETYISDVPAGESEYSDEESEEETDTSSGYESYTESDSSAPPVKRFNLPHPSDLQKAKVIDKILAHEQYPTDPPEEGNLFITKYLVKYKHHSYHHLDWLHELEIEELWTGKGHHMKLRHYQKNNDIHQPFRSGRGSTKGTVYFDIGFLRPERIVAKEIYRNQVYYLVKWSYLNYNDATWETEGFVLDELRQVRMVSLFNAWSVTTPGKLSIGSYRPQMESLPEILTKVRGFSFMSNKKLRDYQQAGVSWMIQNWQCRRPCILGDEMGLGKTCQIITFFESLRRMYGLDGPFLVIAPLATLGHWQREATEWTDFNVVCYGGDGDSRNTIENFEFYHRNNSGGLTKNIKFNIIVTTYEWIIRSPETFSGNKWASIVIDEGHRLKNECSTLFLKLQKFKSDFRMILTGTPVQNNIGELYAILHFLDPKMVPKTKDQFIANYTPLTQERLAQLFELLGDRLLRREKELVEKSIPPKIEIMVKVPMVRFQAQAYKAALTKNGEFLAGDRGRQAASQARNISMELRKCCNHPWLLEGGEAKTLEDAGLSVNGQPPNSDVVMELLLKSSAKMIFLDKLLAKLRKEGHRVLIFSQFVIMLEIIQDYLAWRRYPYEFLCGNVVSDERQRAVDRFQDPNEDSFIFLISTRAGGCGINLTAATKVIIFDSDWNPQNDLQAQARCHRIGQTKQVDVYRVLAENTYEDRMFEIASQKLGLDHVILNAAQQIQDHGKSNMKISDADIEKALRHGAYSLYNEKQESDAKIEENIDELLERAKKIVHNPVSEGDGAAPKTVSAVRGLAAFSTVKFNEINEDPDFWKKVLPEKIDALALMRRLNGDEPPETADQVTEFMELLRTVVTTEITTASEDTKFYMAESLNRQKQVISLLVRVQSLPQFADYSEELKEKLEKVSAPRQFRRAKKHHANEAKEPTPKKENVALLMDPLRRWKTASIGELINATKKYGYGRWSDLITHLRNEGVYPEVDYLTPTMRHCVTAALIESIADYIAEVATNLPRVDTQSKKPTSKLSKKKKSKSQESESSSESSSSSSSSESNDDENEAPTATYGRLEAKITTATIQKVKSLQKGITCFWRSTVLTDLQNTNSKPLLNDKGDATYYPVTVETGSRNEREDDLEFKQFPDIDGESLPRCGTAIKINVVNTTNDVEMSEGSNSQSEKDGDQPAREPWSCMVIIAAKNGKGKDHLRRVHCLTSITKSTCEIQSIMPGDTYEYIVYAVALEPMSSDEQQLLSGDDKYGTDLQKNMLSSVLSTPPTYFSIKGSPRVEAAGISSQKLTDVATQLGSETPEKLTYWHAFGKMFNPLTALSSSEDKENSQQLPSGVEVPSSFKHLDKIEGLKKTSSPYKIFAASMRVFREATGRNGLQLKQKCKQIYQVLTDIAKASLVKQGCHDAALLPEDQIVKIAKQLVEEKFINEDGSLDIDGLSVAATVRLNATLIQPTVNALSTDDVQEGNRDLVEKALSAIQHRVEYAKLLRSAIEEAEKESPTTPESATSMRNICMTVERSLRCKKPPAFWNAKCEYQHLKGILKYGANPAFIVWDPDLGFAEKAAEKKKVKSGERPFVLLFSSYRNYFSNVYSILYKVLSGEIKITVRVKAPPPKAKKGVKPAVVVSDGSSSSSSSDTEKEDSKKVKPKPKAKATPKATPKAKKNVKGAKGTPCQDSYDDRSLWDFMENLSSITEAEKSSQKSVKAFFEKKTVKSAKKAAPKKVKRPAPSTLPKKKTLTLDSDEESQTPKKGPIAVTDVDVLSISDSDSSTQKNGVAPQDGPLEREVASLSGTPTEQDAQESLDPSFKDTQCDVTSKTNDVDMSNGAANNVVDADKDTSSQVKDSNGVDPPNGINTSVEEVNGVTPTANGIHDHAEDTNGVAATNGINADVEKANGVTNGIHNHAKDTNGSENGVTPSGATADAKPNGIANDVAKTKSIETPTKAALSSKLAQNGSEKLSSDTNDVIMKESSSF